MKLWQNSNDSHTDLLQKKVEQFTVGQDTIWDLHLAKYDIIATLAHVKMIAKIGLLSQDDLSQIITGLETIQETVISKTFTIDDGIEDVHSQIEFLLTANIGEAGKKIHAARSRNDQSLVAIKLFLKNEIQEILSQVKNVFDCFIALSEANKTNLLPGYTHLQLAMPSSFGLWFGAFAESLSDDLELLRAAYAVVNKNPLGSAAGYGSSFPIDREFTTTELEFESMNYNVVYAQMTRGKSEKIVAFALSAIAATLTKFATDCCLYMNQNFAFISFPYELTTGSSIMPHKKNPDVFELIRAKCNRIQALPNELTLLTNNLTSGYHRDMQLTKECLFPAIFSLKDCLQMMVVMLENVKVKQEILDNPTYKNLYTVEKVNELVLSGVSFREAYKIVAQSVANGSFEFSKKLAHNHQGSIGNLCNEEIVKRFNNQVQYFK